MSRSLPCAIAIGLCPLAASAQSVEFRIVERFGDFVVLPSDAAPTATAATIGDANDRTLWFVVQARVSGLDIEDFTGLGGFVGSIQVSIGGSAGSFKAAGMGGQDGNPTNSSPVNFLPPGTSDNDFGLLGTAIYEPFRLVANLGAGANGTRPFPLSDTLTDIFGATGGAALERLNPDDLSAAAWGVDNWVNVYAFQYDVLGFGSQSMTFSTDFIASYFTMTTPEGVPNSIEFPNTTQGTYVVTLPTPAAAAVLGLAALYRLRRGRR